MQVPSDYCSFVLLCLRWAFKTTFALASELALLIPFVYTLDILEIAVVDPGIGWVVMSNPYECERLSNEDTWFSYWTSSLIVSHCWRLCFWSRYWLKELIGANGRSSSGWSRWGGIGDWSVFWGLVSTWLIRFIYRFWL